LSDMEEKHKKLALINQADSGHKLHGWLLNLPSYRGKSTPGPQPTPKSIAESVFNSFLLV